MPELKDAAELTSEELREIADKMGISLDRAIELREGRARIDLDRDIALRTIQGTLDERQRVFDKLDKGLDVLTAEIRSARREARSAKLASVSAATEVKEANDASVELRDALLGNELNPVGRLTSLERTVTNHVAHHEAAEKSARDKAEKAEETLIQRSLSGRQLVLAKWSVIVVGSGVLVGVLYDILQFAHVLH